MTFNWIWLIGSEVQSLVAMAGKHSDRKGRLDAGEGAEILHLDPKGTGDYVIGYSLSIGDFTARLHSDALPPTKPHLLQQDHTYSERPHPLQQSHTHSNKATPPNRDSFYRPSIQTHESIQPIQTTTQCMPY